MCCKANARALTNINLSTECYQDQSDKRIGIPQTNGNARIVNQGSPLAILSAKTPLGSRNNDLYPKTPKKGTMIIKRTDNMHQLVGTEVITESPNERTNRPLWATHQ
jgi:hypothetical protein